MAERATDAGKTLENINTPMTLIVIEGRLSAEQKAKLKRFVKEELLTKGDLPTLDVVRLP